MAALSVAVAVHALLLVTRCPEQMLLSSPQARQVQGIAVSLGAWPAAKVQRKQQAPQVTAETAGKEERETEIVPPSAVRPMGQEKMVHVRRDIVKTVVPEKPLHPDPQYTQKGRALTPPEATYSPEPAVFPEQKSPGEEHSATEASPRIIQKASPLYQLNPPPQYPHLARRRGQEGVVVLDVSVDEYGRAAVVSLSVSSGFSLLDEAALKAVRQWRFQSGTINGIARKMMVKVPVRFRLSRM